MDLYKLKQVLYSCYKTLVKLVKKPRFIQPELDYKILFPKIKSFL